MYEMFTGRVPFEADTYMGVLTKHMFMRPEPLTEVYAAARQLGPLEDVTSSAGKTPEARYSSAQEIIDEVNGIVRSSVKVRSCARRAVLGAALRTRDALSCRARGARVSDGAGGHPRGPRWASFGRGMAAAMAFGGSSWRCWRTSPAPAARTDAAGGNEMHGLADKAEPAVPLAPPSRRFEHRPSVASSSAAPTEHAVPRPHQECGLAQRRSAPGAAGVPRRQTHAQRSPLRVVPEI